MKRNIFSISFLAIALPSFFFMLLMTGCGSGTGKKAPALEAAVVPGADFYGRIDYSNARQAPIAIKLQEIGEAKKESSPDDAAAEEKREAFEKATGLEKEDLVAILFSADIDSVDLESKDRKQAAEQLNAVIAVEFSRPLSQEELRGGVSVLAEDKPGTVIQEVPLKGITALAVTSPVPSDPTLYVASAGEGSTVFIAPNTASLEGALARAGGNTPESLPASLTTVERELSDSAQVRLVFFAPEQLREKVDAQMNEMEENSKEKPGAGMFLGFIKPFRKIRSLSMGAAFSENLDLSLVGDLGGEEEAIQAAALMQGFLIPMIKGSFEKKSGAAPADLDERIKVTNSGPVVVLGLTLVESDLAGMAKEGDL